MSDQDVTRIFTRDKSSGRIHVRLEVNGALLVDERDNLDQAGDYEVVDEAVIENAEPDQLCSRCFPRIENDPVGE